MYFLKKLFAEYRYDHPCCQWREWGRTPAHGLLWMEAITSLDENIIQLLDEQGSLLTIKIREGLQHTAKKWRSIMNRINLISLGVRDMAMSLAFYKGIGFQTYETQSQPAIVFFDNKGTKLELYPLEGLAEDINADHPPALISEGFYGITLSINMKSEQEVDAFLEDVVRHGGTIAKKPQRVFWGGYSGYFQDPDGYYWEVAYGPDWKFDENEMLVIEG